MRFYVWILVSDEREDHDPEWELVGSCRTLSQAVCFAKDYGECKTTIELIAYENIQMLWTIEKGFTSVIHCPFPDLNWNFPYLD